MDGAQPPSGVPAAPKANRLPRRRLAMVAVSTLIVGGCVTGTMIVGPCFFDPPPGSVAPLRVINDTATPLTVADCAGAPGCAWTLETTTVTPNRSAALSIESCNADTLGVFRPGEHLPFACLRAPTLNADGQLPPVRLSGAGACE